MSAPKTDIMPGGSEEPKIVGGKRTRGASVKQLKRMLKSAGLKTTGRKAALTRRAKKAHLKLVKKGGNADPTTTSGDVMQGGSSLTPAPAQAGGKKSRSRRYRLF